MAECVPAEECCDTEEIVRGLLKEQYDAVSGEVSPDAFEGNRISYFRLKVFCLFKIIRVLRRDVHRPPRLNLTGYAVLDVGIIKRLGREMKIKKGEKKLKAAPVDVHIYIEPRPEDRAPAHVEIRPNINLTLATQMKNSAVLRSGPATLRHALIQDVLRVARGLKVIQAAVSGKRVSG